MPAEKKIPLQTSNNANVAAAPQGPQKTIEEVYQKKTQLEHILLRPDTYIGSVEKHTQNLWVWENDEMVNRSVSYVPGLYKIFDEILVNAADNKQRDPSMNSLKVVIDAEQNLISVYNNGNGVPVEIHQEEKVYVPELIFGHLLTSSNYDDNEKKTTGGRNGYGAKLTNIFSTEFVIETADGNRQKKYKQVFSENMGKKSDPVIGKAKSGECWTKVSFKPDLAKFNMAYLEEDVVALMKKRVIDMAGCLGKTVKVELNGVRVPVKTFAEYVELYLSSAKKSRTTETLDKFFFEDSNKRWEVCVSVSEGQFQQVSFVNGIATIKGGTHVDYVTNQIANHLMTVVNKKNKNANIKAHNVKNHMWVFVNALIDNPAFDSQTKETLTLRHSSFGSKCEISEDFLKRVSKSTIVDALLSWASFKQNKDLKKTDGTKTGRIQDCPKLEDANLAGGKDSTKCTLILTEGDSAKALAVAGLSVVGRDYYGVFPLRGKLLNVREASPKQLNENKEIINIKKILGLQHGKDYDNVKSLRYGHLMIMTDQDHDGSHIKGLLINFIHAFWPSLLKVPSFMVEFITPIVKATHRNKTVMTFYTMPEYESWKESLGANASSWTIKYYKGLGTSTAQEGKEYFSALTKHKKDFVWKDEQDAEAIELAFSKKKIEARKNWLRQFEPGTYLDQKDSLITYSDFINKELILFSRADLQRSIPSMLDGLKPGQRKILFCSFKKNLVKEQKVAQFVGYASEHSAYHHGETSLAGTIIGMAQDFVGSNNINLLLPNGQFGTRYTGGKDHASARYIYTCLSPVTRFLFPKEDDVLLDYLNEDGQSIEPNWYMPVIPTVLVNGCEGIGTGWSSYIPNYNPRDIIANLKRLLDGEMLVPMDPWYRKFKGTIERIAVRDGVGSYIVSGAMEEIDETTVHITELPVRKWTQDYKEFLETLQGPDKAEPFIKGFMEHHTDTRVEFRIVLSEENLMMARQEGLLKKFKLTSSISLNNMHLFDSTGVIKKYETPEQILEEFYHIRFEYYLKRRKVTLENLELELLKLENKVRFILGVVNGEIIVNNRKRVELVLELQSKGFTPFPKKKSPEAAVAGSTTEDTEEKEDDVTPSNGVRVSDYEYLLSLAISTLTLEKVQELCANRDKLSEDVEEMRRATPEYLWRKDLDALEKALDEQDERDAIAEKESIGKKEERGAAAKKFSKPVARKTTKKPIIKGETVETSTSAMETDNVTEVVVKPKGRAAPRKAPAKKQEKPIVLKDEEDDDDEVMELKDRLAAYNLDSSPDQYAAMETEAAQVPAKKKAPTKRTTAAQKKPSATITMLSDDENQVDGDSEVVVAPKKGGRKAAAAKPPAAAAAKKRGPTKKQQLLTDMMKPAEAAAASPEKKVRKMRASPFNKKSSSILGRIGNDKDEDASGSQENSGAASTPGSGELSDVVPAGPRPRRTNVRQVKYISSDSEGNDSDFSEEVNISEEDESEDDE